MTTPAALRELAEAIATDMDNFAEGMHQGGSALYDFADRVRALGQAAEAATQLRTAAAEGGEAVATIVPHPDDNTQPGVQWHRKDFAIGTKLYLHPPTDSGAGRDGEFGLPDSLVSMAGEAFHRENGLNWDTASMRAAIKSVWPASIVRDAKRFAWLRSRCTDQLCVRVQGDNPIHKHLYGYYQLTGKALDAAIDNAIAGAAGEQG